MRFAGGYDLAGHSGQQKRRASAVGAPGVLLVVAVLSRPADERPTWTFRSGRVRQGQIRSYRSRFMTLSNAATKSCTNFSFASSLA